MATKDSKNISTWLTDVKDSLVGSPQPLVDKEGQLHLDKASPATISAEITRQIDMYLANDKDGMVDGYPNTPTRGLVSTLQEYRNDVNAIRINGVDSKHSGVDDVKKMIIATQLASGIIGPIKTTDIETEYNARCETVANHLAAALGSQEAMAKLVAQKAQSEK